MYQYIASSWVSTEVDYTIPVNDKPTQDEFKNIGNHKNDVTGIKGSKLYQNIKVKVWKTYFHLEKELNTKIQ